MNYSKAIEPHIWRFFRVGGFDQVRIDRASDIASLKALDQKLWAALACPTRGIEFDERTLDLIDSDHDGRIRAPEMLEAIDWTISILKDQKYLENPGDSLPLGAIDDTSERGEAIRKSAKSILNMLGKTDLEEISLQDSLDVERIYSATPFNGDGIIPASSARDAKIQAALEDIMNCLGSEMDRSHKPGVSQTLADRFFSEARDYVAWHAESVSSLGALLPLGDRVESAGALMAELRGKLDDYFTRVRLAEFDARAPDALNPPLTAYETISSDVLTSDGAAIAALPLSRIEAGKPLALDAGINPAWSSKILRFRDEVVSALLGTKNQLEEGEWEVIKKMFGDYVAWSAHKPETVVEKLGVERLTALLAPPVKEQIDALIARDKALEPQMNAIADVEKLLRMKRDMLSLLNNFVSFKDFYTRSRKALFQAGTLYLDSRSCVLCVKVEDEAKHAQLATLSRIYLAYCRCTRSGGTEVMTIAAAFTAGDARNLLVGRNGIFYDRKGRDWDATIVRIVEHPISLRQAFWLPYRQFARFIGEHVQKLAAARSAATQASMAQNTVRTAAAANAPPSPQQQQQQQQQAFDAARFAGIFAAIGLAIGAIGTAIASVVTGFLQLAWWQMPLAVAGIILAVSGPSCVIAMIKLQNRNLGPILDACGWAVNTRLRINLPFGRALTGLAELPERAERALTDPYAERKRPWPLYIALIVLAAVATVLWRMGAF
ncbi:MAG TPA: hypothetical protein VEU95_10675 [Micropepsaceae bacterium]|nr:hypothetical protein [Micropepsaceae bacterium]